MGYRSLKVIKNGTIWKIGYSFLFAFYSNYVICDIFSVREWADLENSVKGSFKVIGNGTNW